MDLIELAGSIVADRFPEARAAFLAGSAGEGRANVYSDLDIVIVLDGPPAPYRETIRVDGWPVELFVHTAESIEHWFTLEREQGTGVLAHMLAAGQPLTGADVEHVRADARAQVAAGPAPWTAAQFEYRRYLVTDALDDLAGARDADERDAVANHLLTLTSELWLRATGHWSGKGKWLLRRLREVDPAVADRLYSSHRQTVTTGDGHVLAAACEGVLQSLGGRVTEGFSVH